MNAEPRQSASDALDDLRLLQRQVRQQTITDIVAALRREESRQVGAVNVPWASDFIERQFGGGDA